VADVDPCPGSGNFGEGYGVTHESVTGAGVPRGSGALAGAAAAYRIADWQANSYRLSLQFQRAIDRRWRMVDPFGILLGGAR
jgi:hypothetical protein